MKLIPPDSSGGIFSWQKMIKIKNSVFYDGSLKKQPFTGTILDNYRNRTYF
jgi:hypothetical protein